VNPRQQRFVDEYLVDLSATNAALRAGYSPKSAGEIGYQLLQKTPIQEAIAERRRLLAIRTGVTPERVLEELAKIGFSNMGDFSFWGPNGVVLRDSSELTKDASACVSEVSETKSAEGGSIKFKLHDKVTALTQIGRHFGMFTDKFEEVAKLPREERKQRLMKLLA
jgi:phage terminase small subunit